MAEKKKYSTLMDLFLLKLQALYDIETQLVKALPKMAKAAQDDELKQGFEDHLQETEGHVNRLEEIFELIQSKPKKIVVDAIRGLVKDAEWMIKSLKGRPTLDAGLITSAQYIEHYKMAGYGSLANWAKMLGYK